MGGLTKSETKKCPYCAEEILSEAVKCKYCGEFLDKQTALLQKSQAKIRQYSNSQPPWKLMVLSVITFGFYDIYWFYRNWKHIKQHEKLDISPGWRTVGLFVPIVTIFMLAGQFKHVRNSAQRVGCETYSSPGGLVAGYLVLIGLSARLARLWEAEDSASLLGLALVGLLLDVGSAGILATVQATLNSFWTKEQPGLLTRVRFSTGEIVALVIGGLWWVLTFIGIFLPTYNF